MAKKGITPIITVILLLLIAVVMVGFAFGFFQQIFTTSSQEATTTLNTTVSIYGKQIRVDNINGTTADVRTVTIRAIASKTIAPGDVKLYNATGSDVTSALTTCPNATVAPGATGTCLVIANGCLSQSTLRVSAPGNADTRTCP